MKLYYSPGACSLATRIVLHEAGLDADYERVDLKAKLTERGADYLALNPAGSVPLLVLDDGQAVTENVAILTLLAEMAPKLGNGGPLGQIRLIEMLSFLSTELHIAFKPYFHGAEGEELAEAAEAVGRRLDLIADRMVDPYLFGSHFSVADAYLFVMLRWGHGFHIPLPPSLGELYHRILERDTVRQSIVEEALPASAPAGAMAGG